MDLVETDRNQTVYCCCEQVGIECDCAQDGHGVEGKAMATLEPFRPVKTIEAQVDPASMTVQTRMIVEVVMIMVIFCCFGGVILVVYHKVRRQRKEEKNVKGKSWSDRDKKLEEY